MSKRLNVTYAQMALGLKYFVNTQQSIDGNPALTTVYGVTRSSYINRHYVLLGTAAEPNAWFAVHPSLGIQREEDICLGWLKPEPPEPIFVAELARQFQLDIDAGRKARKLCS